MQIFSNDLVLLGKCDDVIHNLGKELGWEELDREWSKTAAFLDTVPMRRHIQ
jgi:hypothetical protein